MKDLEKFRINGNYKNLIIRLYDSDLLLNLTNCRIKKDYSIETIKDGQIHSGRMKQVQELKLTIIAEEIEKKEYIETNSKINFKFKKAIFLAGLTQRKLAEKIGMHESTISHYIHGRLNFNDLEKQIISDVLKCKKEDLFEN